jgi:hypothetical protein
MADVQVRVGSKQTAADKAEIMRRADDAEFDRTEAFGAAAQRNERCLQAVARQQKSDPEQQRRDWAQIRPNTGASLPDCGVALSAPLSKRCAGHNRKPPVRQPWT